MTVSGQLPWCLMPGMAGHCYINCDWLDYTELLLIGKLNSFAVILTFLQTWALRERHHFKGLNAAF